MSDLLKMETAGPRRCHCDPLKILAGWFLRHTLSEFELPASELLNTPLFYKSSVFKCWNRNENFGVRILQETLRAAKDWAESMSKVENERLKTNFQHLEKIMVQCRGLEDVSVDQYVVKRAVPDKIGNVNLLLEIEPMKEAIIRWHIAGSSERSFCQNHNKSYFVEIGMSGKSGQSCNTSLQDYRKTLVAQAISTVVKKVGHRIDDAHFTCIPVDKNIDENTLFIVGSTSIETTHDQNPLLVSDLPNVSPEVVLRLPIGRIHPPQNLTRKTPLSELLNDRISILKEISESRRLESVGESSWVTSVYNLAISTLNYDILSKPQETDLLLLPLDNNRMNHDALLILYNYSRLLSILRRFDELISSGEYPPLPDINSVNFNLICKTKEEMELLQLLLEWPRVQESIVNFMRLETSLQMVPKFLFILSKAFNSFYFEIQVLVPSNGPHNFPAMMSRIYFMKAICTIFEDCLHILQISHSNNKAHMPMVSEDS